MEEKRALFDNLVTAYSPWLYRYAYWLCDSRTVAEDLVQETFLRAWRFIGSLESEAAAKSWLTTILRRENARRFERKQLDYQDVETDMIPEESEGADRSDILTLRKGLKALPVKYREPLILQVIDGYKLEEIASMLELPRNTVATRLHRARQKLKSYLDEGAERKAQ